MGNLHGKSCLSGNDTRHTRLSPGLELLKAQGCFIVKCSRSAGNFLIILLTDKIDEYFVLLIGRHTPAI